MSLYMMASPVMFMIVLFFSLLVLVILLYRDGGVSNEKSIFNLGHTDPAPMNIFKNETVKNIQNKTLKPVIDKKLSDTVQSLIKITLEEEEVNLKYILFWSRNYGDRFESYGLSPLGGDGFKGCEESRCIGTDDRKLLANQNMFDAIFFNDRSIDDKGIYDRPDPLQRKENQRYVLWLSEAPEYVDYSYTNLSTLNNYFNWTYSYRRDSTFYVPWNNFVQVKDHPTGEALEQYMDDFGKANVAIAERNTIEPVSASIAWVVSNCPAKSGRDNFTQELERLMPVDIYGRCGSLNCSRSQDCWSMIATKYKFYLAMENSLCRDYFTSKYYGLVNQNIIQITLNSEEMAKVAPPRSYINVMDFDSVQELADYLKKVENDPALFASYFWWRNHYTFKSEGEYHKDAFCKICKTLHEDTEETRKIEMIEDPYEWWVNDAKCWVYQGLQNKSQSR